MLLYLIVVLTIKIYTLAFNRYLNLFYFNQLTPLHGNFE